MVTNVLIVEPDALFADQLVQALNEISPLIISVVPSVKEACLMLTQREQDLLFLPVSEDERPLRALRALQSDVRVVLTTPTPEPIPELFVGKVQGVLIKPLLRVDLVSVLTQAVGQPVVLGEPLRDESDAQPLQKIDQVMFQQVLTAVSLGRVVQAAIIADGAALVSHSGQLSEAEAATIAAYVAQDWALDTKGAMLQFMHLPARAGELLLYSCSINEAHLLTLAAEAEAPVSELRLRAERIIKLLIASEQQAGEDGGKTAVLPEANDENNSRPSYAIAWRPVDKLPSGLLTPLRRALERLAGKNSMVITFIEVMPDIIHLVVDAPSSRTSGSAAYLLKNGAEQIIQREFGLRTPLWQTGFHAAESDEPLTDAELNIFLADTT